MARAQGARAQMALAYETVYGTPPVSGFRLMPFARATLGSEQPLLESELLGYGRDPLAPIKDAVTADGEVVIPIDVKAFGFWLKAAFGQPTTSGTTPKTHTFQSGNWTLPTMAIETAMPEVPRFAMYSGCVLDQLTWQMQRSGLLTATARLVAQGETIAAATAAGTPTALGLQRFGHFNGTVKRNGSALGNVVSAEITYSNNLDRIETIRGDGRIDGVDPAMAALAGRMRDALRRGLERHGRPDLMPATDIAGTPAVQRPQQIEQPAAPASCSIRTVSATPSRSSAKHRSLSTLSGTRNAAVSSATCATSSSRVTP